MTLRGCFALDPASLCAALQGATHLQALDLAGCRLTAGVLRALGASCASLEELYLGAAWWGVGPRGLCAHCYRRRERLRRLPDASTPWFKHWYPTCSPQGAARFQRRG